MPNTLGLSESDLDEFLQHGYLLDYITVPVMCWKVSMEHGNVPEFTLKERMVYDKVNADLATIENMLANIVGKSFADCPFDKEINCNNGYRFERLEYIGRHVISIKRPGVDDFYWTIGVGDAGWCANDSPIHQYYNIGTNGNVAEVMEALENTKDLFPALTPKSTNARVMHTRAKSYVMKI